jgi:hypothetical protein
LGLSHTKNKYNGEVSLRDGKPGPRIAMRGFSMAMVLIHGFFVGDLPEARKHIQIFSWFANSDSACTWELR